MSDKTRLACTVFVGGLAPGVTTEILYDAFIPFGIIVDVSMPKPDLPSSTEPHRGFGYVEFEEAEDAGEAIYNMDQSELFGRVIKAAAAKPQKSGNEGLGSKTAVWEQEGYQAKHAAAEEDPMAASQEEKDDAPQDPMEGLEGLDVAGPKAEP